MQVRNLFEIEHRIEAYLKLPLMYFPVVPLEVSIQEGIDFLSDPSNVLFIVDHLQMRRTFKRPSFMGSLLLEKLDRYLVLRNNIFLWSQLVDNGCNVELGEVITLDESSLVFLHSYFLNDTSKRGASIKFHLCTLDMLANIEQLSKLINRYPSFDDYSYLASLSLEQLNVYLGFLLRHPSDIHDIKLKHAFAKRCTDSDTLLSYITMHNRLFSHVLHDREGKFGPFILGLSESLRVTFRNLKYTDSLLQALEMISHAPKKIDEETINFIFSNKYLLDRFAANKPCHHELSAILSGNYSLYHLRVVFGTSGVECHDKHYCGFVSQLGINPHVLSVMQKVMLQKKLALNTQLIKSLSAPNVAAAYQAGFIDERYILSSTKLEFDMVATYWKQAKRANIKDAWDSAFGELVQAEESKPKSANKKASDLQANHMWEKSNNKAKKTYHPPAPSYKPPRLGLSE